MSKISDDFRRGLGESVTTKGKNSSGWESAQVHISASFDVQMLVTDKRGTVNLTTAVEQLAAALITELRAAGVVIPQRARYNNKYGQVEW